MIKIKIFNQSNFYLFLSDSLKFLLEHSLLKDQPHTHTHTLLFY